MKKSSSAIYFLFSILLSLNFGCTTGSSNSGVRIDNVPMYGGESAPRTPEQVKGDQEFIKKASSTFGDRYEASKIWWERGEKYRHDGNLDFAMRRYNQAWLLDPGNYQPYWGFGLVLAQQGREDKAIHFLKKSEELVNDDYQKAALVSDLAIIYSSKALSNASYFKLANEKFEESVVLDPSYINSWGNWAYALYQQGEYMKAWEKVHKVRELNGPLFSSKFISELSEKMPEPK